MSLVTAKEKLLKQPADIRNYTMDFENLLNGYYITGVTLAEGTPVGLSITNTGISIDTQSVNMTIASGTKNVDYYVAVRVITTNSEIIEGDGKLQVRDI